MFINNYANREGDRVINDLIDAMRKMEYTELVNIQEAVSGIVAARAPMRHTLDGKWCQDGGGDCFLVDKVDLAAQALCRYVRDGDLVIDTKNAEEIELLDFRPFTMGEACSYHSMAEGRIWRLADGVECEIVALDQIGAVVNDGSLRLFVSYGNLMMAYAADIELGSVLGEFRSELE
jgi:hypothetical protein